MRKWFLNIILYMLSRFPILSITIDSEYHEISWGNYNLKDLRLSLISFALGFCKVYLLTWKDKKFELFKVIRIEEIKKIPNDKELDEKEKQYTEYLDKKDDETMTVEIDFLKYKIEQNEATKELALNKINTYCAIILFLLPLCFTFIGEIDFTASSRISLLLSILVMYCMINISTLILDFYKVRRYSRVLFSNIKGSANPKKTLAISYYNEWYSIKAESPLFVAYVRNIERYLKFSVLFFIMLSLSVNYITWSKPVLTAYDKLAQEKFNSINYVEDFELTQGELSKKDLDNLIRIQKFVKNNRFREIIVLSDMGNDSNSKYKKVIESIKMFNCNDIKITEVVQKNKDNELHNYIKIILLEELK